MENEMKGLITNLVTSMSQQLASQGIGRNSSFDNTNFTKIEVDKNVSEKLIYKDIEFYADDIHYVFVKEGSMIYKGLIDSEGAKKTIFADIISTKDFINFMLTISNEDVESLEKLLDTPETLELIGMQLGLGIIKGVENNHY